ncbi:MAG: DUF6259 domain-containing protein, partial [Planctomycetota bacterium]
MAIFLHRLVLAVVVLAGFTDILAQNQKPNIKIANDHYLIEVNPKNGLITQVYDKAGKLELIQEPRLADNFKFSLPIRGEAAWQSTEANYILGKDQPLTSYKSNDAEMVLKWDGPMASVFGKPYDVSAVMTIQLVAEDVRFTFKIKNDTQLEIGEVYYPILGGSLGFGEALETRKKTELVIPKSRNIVKASIYHTFENFSWLGVLGPEQYYTYPNGMSMPWMELYQPQLNRSVYFGAHDPVARYKIIHLEMSPGIAGARPDGNWPRPEELKGLPAGVKMCFVHFPYQPPGQDFEATPVVLRFHDGDWHKAAKIYRDWFGSQYDLAKPRTDWLYRTPAFQECGVVNFKDLPQWAKQCADAGVKNLLLTKWKIGGHYIGIPRFEPETGLGSREQLAEAIQQCHELGVKVTLLINLQPVNRLDKRYPKKLDQYACKDRWGIVHTKWGRFYNSPLTGGHGQGGRRIWLNPGHPGMRKFLVDQIRVLAELGVDGVHLQGFITSPLDFNLSTDSIWDRWLAVTQVCSVQAGDLCALRSAFTFWQPTFTIADGDDLRVINDALRYRGRLRIVPSNRKPMGGPEMAELAG